MLTYKTLSQRIVDEQSSNSNSNAVDKVITLIRDSISGFTTSFTFLVHIFRESEN